MADTLDLSRPATALPDALIAGLKAGTIIPYLGPGVLDPTEGGPPGDEAALAAFLSGKVSVPHKVRKVASGAAQFIENFKHRKTLDALMAEAFGARPQPSELVRALASLPQLPLIVHAWHDTSVLTALQARDPALGAWGLVQGLSPAENMLGTWHGYYRPDGSRIDHIGHATGEAPPEVSGWAALLYQPLGCALPAGNHLVSDSDFVEVLTEFDIQTPIPDAVQARRTGRGFVFIGCRFASQTERTFARQTMKRSAGPHWMLVSGDPTRN
jgi:hypothetical protein